MNAAAQELVTVDLTGTNESANIPHDLLNSSNACSRRETGAGSNGKEPKTKGLRNSALFFT